MGNRPPVGCPPYVADATAWVGCLPYVDDTCSDPILAFALSGRELLGTIFHRALPCAMSFLPRWGGLVCRCVLAIQLSACADVTAWQSVTHLTLLPTLLFGYLTQPPNVIFMTAGSI
ncbi:MAG: hypothetical protein LBQ66_16180, partial [Planctomycetaceae bacterium]|nr:hypothetical protein [Planctomycetaceae bacterium]